MLVKVDVVTVAKTVVVLMTVEYVFVSVVVNVTVLVISASVVVNTAFEVIVVVKAIDEVTFLVRVTVIME